MILQVRISLKKSQEGFCLAQYSISGRLRAFLFKIPFRFNLAEGNNPFALKETEADSQNFRQREPGQSQKGRE
ncbi:hypothetical protein CH365_08395 [Leptospira neocaledonica]|uniref:Uncharacterized protein n=1 Tax=Leptospira neocaledonica TaxID=2023192 RepID=A0A2N0A085_9LEPT|nr:hypothetical protein CH365_08395 [Leptospira neocaledonica]